MLIYGALVELVVVISVCISNNISDINIRGDGGGDDSLLHS